jgi:triosephosphate isomerase
MYKDIWVRNILVGHSERREYFNETNEITNKKVLKIIENDLNAMLCVWEKDWEDAKAVLKEQIKQGLSNISEEQLSNLKIAYEPVWAIGTWKTAEPEQAQERHEFIRELLSKQYNTNIAQKIPILYWWSVNEENAWNLLSQNDIDWALVGWASLRAEKFWQIITQAL